MPVVCRFVGQGELHCRRLSLCITRGKQMELLRPVVHSERCQEFLGVRYYLCGRYFQKRGMRLHRHVYATNFVAIPPGRAHHVHHIDGNPHNNSPENLQLRDGPGHVSEHLREDARSVISRGSLLRAAPSAAKWHRSEEGREWHRKNFKALAVAIQKRGQRDCLQCGATFEGHWAQRYCTNACKSAARRDSGADTVTRSCAGCGADFPANKYTKIVYCGRSCAARAQHQAKRRPAV